MASAVDPADHNSRITEQFTRQAVQFAQLHSADESADLMIRAAEVGPGDSVLDVACGPGLVACAFAAVVGRVAGIDLTLAMIELAKQLQRERGLSNVDWHVGDVTELPFADGAFSAVVSRYALHHMLRPAQVIREMARVTSPGGRVVVADVFMQTEAQARKYDTMEKFRDPSHVHALQLDELLSQFGAAGVTDVQKTFVRFDADVDALLIATRTAADGAEQFRQIVEDDVGKNELGIDARRNGKKLGFSFPLVILGGRVAGA